MVARKDGTESVPYREDKAYALLLQKQISPHHDPLLKGRGHISYFLSRKGIGHISYLLSPKGRG